MGLIFTKNQKNDKSTIHYSLVNAKNLLIIFTRNPELGKCKTRLAATVGDETALEIYTFLLKHTVEISTNLNVAKQVYYSELIPDNDLWDAQVYTKKQQKGNDLGERMEHAFQEGFAEGFEKICIIGSDMFDLEQNDLEQAFVALDTSDFVLGPALDGGYYLIGMKVLEPSIFKNKKWGTDTVLKDTLNDLNKHSLHLLNVRNDVDLYEDIKDVEAFKPFLIKHENN
ncbi:MAG: TIGR04282 family arsenosugar biosynthesis glycosyltransferase [Flavobacteriaceae bacterium]